MGPIRWGILGCGDIAEKRVAESIQLDPRSELVAACRRDSQKLAIFCDRFAVPKAFTNSIELIRSDDVDAVYVATPVVLHRQNVLDAAAAAGKHIIVEKPMGLNSADCDEMVAACQNAGVALSVAYYRRFYPIVHRMKQLIDSGELGRPISVSASAGNPRLFPNDDWRVVRSQSGGGPLMDIGSHRIDLFLDLFGDVDHVMSLVESIESNYETEDTAVVAIRFATGKIGILETYFGASDVPDRFAIMCTRGSITTDSLNRGELLVRRNNESNVEQHPPHANLHAPLVADFTNAVLERRSPTVTGVQGADVNRVIDMAYRAGNNL